MSSSNRLSLPEAERRARLRAAQVPGLGGGLLQRLLERYGTVSAALDADPRELQALLGFEVGRQLADPAGLEARWRACAGALARVGARAYVRGEAAYPPPLERLDRPPAVLYVRGDPITAAGVAVVGTRTASKAACDGAFRLAAGLAEAGRPVVSGGAYGIDAAAHGGALDAGGGTVVVFGGGLDRPYPDRHIALFERAAKQGSLLSPFRPGTPPLRGGFLARNSIIAALSEVVVVVNAGWRSGARSTAVAARRLGIPVCAMAGSPGCDRLIAEGAAAVRDVEDVLGLLSGRPPAPPPEADRDSLLSPSHRRLVAALEAAGSTAEAVAAKTGLDPGRVLAELMELVLDGRVAQRPGGRFFRRLSPEP